MANNASYPDMVGKVALITGGGVGLGKAMAQAFAAQGATVVIADVNQKAGQAAQTDINRSGGKSVFVTADVGYSDQVAALMDAVKAQCGGLDYLINNAGLTQFGRPQLAEIGEDQFDQIVRVNLKGVWLCMRYGIPLMLEKGAGCIVNISSAMGLVSQPGVSIYTATKHGVLGLTKAGAIEYGRRGIRVNAICPGRHETPMIQSNKARYTPEAWEEQVARVHPATGRMGRPEEIAAAALFLCSETASNIHGVALPVDGGFVIQ